ncbi:MAG: hypothetical protein N3J91_05210 [Verrucomicrobiae bacterium]|nr:hypothetical protein [Verrucomicrobiae bacterium]
MRAKVAIIILVAVCVLLGVALISVSQKTKAREKESVTIQKTNWVEISNTLASTSSKVEELQQVNTHLTNQLASERRKVETLTGETKRLEGTLQRVTAERDDLKQEIEQVKKAAAEAAAVAEKEIARHTAKIAELEKEREVLTRTMEQLTNQIAQLEVKIAETEKQLAAATGQNDFLLKELQRLRAEKAELERQFNDLKIVSEQKKKLTEEHHIALRLEWMRRGLYQDMRGGERLVRGLPKPASATTNASLEAEIRRSGSSTIKSATNAPAAPK